MINNTNDKTVLPVNGQYIAPEAAPAPRLTEVALPPLMDAQGDFAPEWYSRFEELQPYAASLSKFRRPEALAKSYAHLERFRGYPDPADAKRMASFRSVVGLPDDVADYVLTRPENTPDEAWDEGMATALAKVAYEYGVPAPAMAAITEKYVCESKRMLDSCREQEHAAVIQADNELQQEWGRSYEDNMRTVGDFLEHMGAVAGVDVKALAENPALRANADFARLMLTIAHTQQEAPMRRGTPADSRDEAYRIAHDPTHPLHEAYMRTNHPQHRYANEQYDRAAFGRPL